MDDLIGTFSSFGRDKAEESTTIIVGSKREIETVKEDDKKTVMAPKVVAKTLSALLVSLLVKLGAPPGIAPGVAGTDVLYNRKLSIKIGQMLLLILLLGVS